MIAGDTMRAAGTNCFVRFRNRCWFVLNVEVEESGRMVLGIFRTNQFKDIYVENAATGSANQGSFHGKY
jgi:hypothetical protein